MRPLLPLVLSIALGCSTPFPLERAARIFGSGEPEVPPLIEEPTVDLPAPKVLRATSGELRAVPLEWEPVLTGDVFGYAIERRVGGEETFHRIAAQAGRFENGFIDRGTDLAPKFGSDGGRGDLGDGRSYEYRVRAFTPDGNVAAEASPTVRATTAPPPAAPADLRAYSQLPRKVALAWSAVPDPTVAGYVVYRSPSAGGEFLPMVRLEDRFATTWVDRDLGDLRVFYYQVAAVNRAGGEGARTPARRAVTKPEPLPPAGLRLEAQQLGSNRLTWERNVEPDLAGYRLLRQRELESGTELVTTVGAGETSCVDREVGAGERLTYTAVAFDADGLESAPAEAVSVESVDYALEVRAEEGFVILEWDPAVHADFAEARILRVGRLRSTEIARSEEPGFVDREVEPGRRYRYQVVLVQEDGSEAPPSAPVEIQLNPRDLAAETP